MNSTSDHPASASIEIALYQAEGRPVPVEVRYMNETFWLTQAEMAGLFGCSSDNISLHLKNIFKEGELTEGATTEEISVVQQEGSTRNRTSTAKSKSSSEKEGIPMSNNSRSSWEVAA